MAVETLSPALTPESIVEQIDQIAVLDSLKRFSPGLTAGNNEYLAYKVEELEELLFRKPVVATAIDPFAQSITRHRRLMFPRRNPPETISWFGSNLKYVPAGMTTFREQASGLISGFDIDQRAIIVNPDYFWRSSLRDWVRLVDQQGQPLVRLEFP